MRVVWMKLTALLVLLALAAFGCGHRQGSAQGTDAQAVVAQGTDAPAAVAQGTDTQAVVAQVADTLKVKLTYEQRKGQRLFLHYCAVCHGIEGAGDGFNAWNLDPKPRDLSDASYQGAVSDEWLAEVIAQGGRGVSRSPLMPAWGHTLTEDQIREVISFIRTLTRKPTPS